MTAGSHTLIGTILDTRYTLVRLLGTGGMGGVFAAVDQQTGQEVALKLLLPPDAVQSQQELLSHLEQRMRREVRLLSKLNDPRIVQLYGWGHDDLHGLFYTMELLSDGFTLLEYLVEYQPGLTERLELLSEILLALDVLHQEQIIHRDLKPSNVFCVKTPNGPQVKLIDLGIARWFSDVVRTHITVETAPGTMLGSPAYMSPEMWRNEDVDATTDIYQMGILGYELITNELPFSGTPHQLMFQHLHGFLPSCASAVKQREPEVTSHTLELMDACLEQATHKDPTQRFSNVREFAIAIQSAKGGEASDNMILSLPEQSQKRASFGWLLVPGLVILFIGVWWSVMSSRQSGKQTKRRVMPEQILQPKKSKVQWRNRPRKIPVKAKRMIRPLARHTVLKERSQPKKRQRLKTRLKKPNLMDTLLSP